MLHCGRQRQSDSHAHAARHSPAALAEVAGAQRGSLLLAAHCNHIGRACCLDAALQVVMPSPPFHSQCKLLCALHAHTDRVGAVSCVCPGLPRTKHAAAAALPALVMLQPAEHA